MSTNERSKMTPGPWESGDKLTGGSIEVTAERGTMQVARVNGKAGEQEANARAIAALPELIAALQTILGHGIGYPDLDKMGRDALRKAGVL